MKTRVADSESVARSLDNARTDSGVVTNPLPILHPLIHAILIIPFHSSQSSHKLKLQLELQLEHNK